MMGRNMEKSARVMEPESHEDLVAHGASAGVAARGQFLEVLAARLWARRHPTSASRQVWLPALISFAVTAPRRCSARVRSMQDRHIVLQGLPGAHCTQKTERPCNKGCHRLVKRTHKHECD